MPEENTQSTNQEITEGNYYTPYNVDVDDMSGPELEEYISHASGLPAKIDEIFTDFSTAEFIEESLGPKFQLAIDQKSEVTRIIRDVLLGDVFIGDMPTIISQRLSLDQNTARDISSALVSELFAPAIEEIKKMQAANFSDRMSKKASAPPAPQQAGPQRQPMPQKQQRIPGEGLPETGGNIIDLRNQ